MPYLLAERTPRACSFLDIIGPAKKSGWLATWSLMPAPLNDCVAWLALGSQAIPVRLVFNDTGVSDYLEQLTCKLLTDFHLEQFVIMEGFTPDQVTAFKLRVAHPQRRIHVGTYAQYLHWVGSRLGYLGRLSIHSPVRKLLETFLAYNPLSAPTTLAPLVGNFDTSAIKDSFLVGAEGVQAITTLLRHVHGAAAVENVEADKAWQTKDVDLLVRCQASGQWVSPIKVEVKNEKWASGNLSLENFSSFDHKTPGWLHYSAADVLISGVWPTGDFIVMDFQKVRDWILGGDHQVPLKHGRAAGQTYKSQFYCTPIHTLLAQFEDVIALKLDTWLPEAYAGRFDAKSLVPVRFQSRQLQPFR